MQRVSTERPSMYKLALLNYATKRMKEDPRRRSLPSCILRNHFDALLEGPKVSP